MVAASISDAQATLTEAPPSIVIADWHLPDGDGLSLLQTLPGTPPIPLIVMSSHGDALLEKKAVDAGAAGFIEKSGTAFSDMHQTVEEAIADTDVGIKIFTGLNVNKGLPVPVVVRFDYHGQVPGARERAEQHCQRVTRALNERYAILAEQGLLHILQVIRDCNANAPIEVLHCSAKPEIDGGH